MGMHAPPPPLAKVCSARVTATAQRFTTSDGVSIYGATLGGGRVGIVLVPQHYRTSCEWVPEAKRLAAKGYAVMVFDVRDTGQSASSPPATTGRTDLDTAAAAAALRARGATKIVLVGSLIGGLAALDAAAEVTPPVSAVVAVAPPDNNGLIGEPVPHLTKAAERARVPTLLLAAQVAGIAPQLTRNVYDLLTTPTKQLLRLEGSALYGVDLFKRRTTESAVVRFIAAHTR